MKISFITIHVGNNFGSVLQTIATSYILKELGHDPICVNYIPPRVTIKSYWLGGLSSVIRLFRRILYFPVFYIARMNYKNYLKKYCDLSRPIYLEDDFPQKCPKADFYITGSDQVWNYLHNRGIDKHYFFEGIQGKKIAFASSIGMTDLPVEYANYMKNALQSYNAISVRENSAVNILTKWGIKSTQLIDPTLLIDKKAWCNFSSKPLCKEPYLFVYLPYNVLDYNLVYVSAKKIANEKNLKVITYSYDIFKKKGADKTVLFANPGDILSLFLHADYIITNSFHGTAFSINLNKQFWVYMPSSFSTRLISLLELCKLQNRILDGIIKEDKINSIVEFDTANNILYNERCKARKFLVNSLK